MPPKLVLAFDTSAAHCAVALVLGDRVLADVAEPMTKGQAERLFPLIEQVLADAGYSYDDLDAVGVGVGPGNFTGVRISVSAARGLALARGIPAIGVSRLHAMAHGATGLTTTVLDARRGRVYMQYFDNGTAEDAPKMIAIEDIDMNKGQIIIAPEDADFIEQYKMAQRPVQSIALATALIACDTIDHDHPRPAPLYLRDADAAVSSEPLPTIL
ncbi:tRNA N6-adenosine(37)-N6-threonylcarbamoyltransferase complex dimerization subunit TsaB [Amylibacter kogurei]|uniref:tRNA N6-adenosine(37)-N6-threonylcarbamoyltransferase complex dimerization subunit TsaB n=1 Tax=Paramylibacter kogurei TaxID=1889778 RepID=A0A2G5K948_9RHOB|nr:tRNA (adenosine(37)-N6)-threonylcarbamoyltransferase complex dimerization subunit type 1 TsaB [Amylibacter kogurei]PIB25659.1 tRNA N6-adenosine(37)-N6-threonylcarbamoyltransferase complex dimerization subunit TsaB [Amylibacter kogurei]